MGAIYDWKRYSPDTVWKTVRYLQAVVVSEEGAICGRDISLTRFLKFLQFYDSHQALVGNEKQ